MTTVLGAQNGVSSARDKVADAQRAFTSARDAHWAAFPVGRDAGSRTEREELLSILRLNRLRHRRDLAEALLREAELRLQLEQLRAYMLLREPGA